MKKIIKVHLYMSGYGCQEKIYENAYVELSYTAYIIKHSETHKMIACYPISNTQIEIMDGKQNMDNSVNVEKVNM